MSVTTGASRDLQSDVLLVYARRWRLVVLLAFVGGLAGAAYALLAPKWYAATLAVIPSDRNTDSASAAIAAKLPIEMDTGSSSVARIRAVLTSTSVADAVIDKFNLQERYGVAYREKARLALWQHCNVDADKKSNVVALACEDKDPKVAMDMVQFFGEEGNRVFGRVSASSAREERKFLETQVEKARKDVDDSSAKLREFQQNNKLVDLPEQSKAVITAMASIQGDLVSKNLELSYLTSFSSRGEARVMQLQQQVAILQSKLKQLEETSASVTVTVPASTGSGAGSADFFPPAMNVPALRFELEQLIREQKIRETVFFMLVQRFEMARVDEARDTSTFQILDYPTLPTYPSRPKRMQLGLFGIAAGLAVSFAWVLLPIWWRRRARA